MTTECEQQAERLEKAVKYIRSELDYFRRARYGKLGIYLPFDTWVDIPAALVYYARGALGVEIGTEKEKSDA